MPDDLETVLRKAISPDEGQILIVIMEEFLTPSQIANRLKLDDLGSIVMTLRTLYQRGFVSKKIVEGEEAYRSRSFYHIVRSHLEEDRYQALGLEHLNTLRSYYITTRIRKTEEAINSGELKYSSKVILIEKAIKITQYMLPTEQAIDFLKKAKLIALTKCGCRVVFKNCHKPIDVCILLDEEAEELVGRGYAKPITLKEAEETLKIANTAGLVHLTLYLPSQKIYAIRSCCPCCCHDLQALIKYGKTLFVVKSDYTVTIDRNMCIDCGTCIKRCIFSARKIQNGKSIVIEENRYGCGLCITTCPTEASTLMPRV